jgi:malonyl-CoA O-methyltransferase
MASPLYRRVAKRILGRRLSARIVGLELEWERRKRRRRIGNRQRLPYARALEWAKRHEVPGGGIVQTDIRREAFPEVTGYFIPTLYEAGERDVALRNARWLVGVVRPDGSVPAPDGGTYVFCAGQALRGLLAAVEEDSSLEAPCRRVADFLCSQIGAKGTIASPSEDTHIWGNGRRLPDTYRLYVLPPLAEAGRVFAERTYLTLAQRACDYYSSIPTLLDDDMLSHFHAYVVEALVDLGHRDLARIAASRMADRQKADGSLPAYPSVKWTCSTGNLQWAVIWYKLGMRQPAERAMAWAERYQEPSGGFRGSYALGANYSSTEEISWAVKYFLDAVHWRIRTGFDAEEALHPADLALSDGRLTALLEALGDLNGKRVLDAGCGKGRFGKVLKQLFPECELWGVDSSRGMLQHVGGAFPVKMGSLLHLSFPAGEFDAVYCVESLQHVPNWDGALRELRRALRPGGTLAIIDRNAKYLGVVDISPWERWFQPDAFIALLERHFVRVSMAPVPQVAGQLLGDQFLIWRCEANEDRAGDPPIIRETETQG